MGEAGETSWARRSAEAELLSAGESLEAASCWLAAGGPQGEESCCENMNTRLVHYGMVTTNCEFPYSLDVLKLEEL